VVKVNVELTTQDLNWIRKVDVNANIRQILHRKLLSHPSFVIECVHWKTDAMETKPLIHDISKEKLFAHCTAMCQNCFIMGSQISSCFSTMGAVM